MRNAALGLKALLLGAGAETQEACVLGCTSGVSISLSWEGGREGVSLFLPSFSRFS